jgi:peptide deformylase
MAIKKVLRIGDPLLSEVSQAVIDPGSNAIKHLIEDMSDTMHAYEGAGLAAPQIGVLSRLVIFGFEHNPRYPAAEAVPKTVLINPEIELLTDDMESDWEGCLSVPGMRGLVPRHTKIRYTGLDQRGEKIERVVSGFHARVVLHECDHLDGIIYPQRIQNLSDFGFIEELQQSGRYKPAPCDSDEGSVCE